MCEQGNGTCSCDVGYTGNNCSMCTAGYVKGESGNCLKCPDNCVNNTCDSLLMCAEGCTRGNYGTYCNKTCNMQCVDSECSRDTGNCTRGCTDGYEATDTGCKGTFKLYFMAN